MSTKSVSSSADRTPPDTPARQAPPQHMRRTPPGQPVPGDRTDYASIQRAAEDGSIYGRARYTPDAPQMTDRELDEAREQLGQPARPPVPGR